MNYLLTVSIVCIFLVMPTDGIYASPMTASATSPVLPYSFVPNAGQWDVDVLFEAKVKGATLLISGSGMHLHLVRQTPHVLQGGNSELSLGQIAQEHEFTRRDQSIISEELAATVSRYRTAPTRWSSQFGMRRQGETCNGAKRKRSTPLTDSELSCWVTWFPLCWTI